MGKRVANTFNAKALKALGFDPAVARELGYPIKDSEESESSVAAYPDLGTLTTVRDLLTLS